MKVLVCPLDWGLGHAARCVPLIRALRACGHEVRVGASGGGRRLLQGEFPDLDVFDFPGYRVRYARSPAFFMPVMLMQLPRVLWGMRAESRRLRSILAEHPCDAVISDGRYGVRARGVTCVFLTHQIFIRPGRFPGSGLAEKILLALNLRLLRRFDRVWVPDFPGADSLSGELSRKPGSAPNDLRSGLSRELPGLEFIGPLARFTADAMGAGARMDAPVDVLALVSGPEPQRTLFEAAVKRELQGMAGTRVLVRGLPGAAGPARSEKDSSISPVRPASHGIEAEKPIAADMRIAAGGLTVFDHLPGAALAGLMARAGTVVARSGYTTLMEMAGLGVKAAVLVPTPGQSEQEYLADHLEASRTALRMDQDRLQLARAQARLDGYRGFARWKERFDGDPDAHIAAFIRAHPLLKDRSAEIAKASEVL